MDLLSLFNSSLRGEPDWPPPEVRAAWEDVELYRWRFEWDRARLVAQNTRWHGDAEDVYVPVPFAREIGRLSAALLFSEPATITHEKYQDELEEILRVRKMDAFLQASAEYVAIEGRGGLKVFFDDSIKPGVPLIHYIHEDQILWTERHGHVTGGTVVYEREHPTRKNLVWRLLEEHSPGYVRRALYEGSAGKLGREIDISNWGDEALEEEVETGLDTATLIPWENVPGAASDLKGLDSLLDELDEAESLLLDKGRKSVPVVFADRSLADPNGVVARTGVIFTGDGRLMMEMGEEGKGAKIETVQPGLQSSDHIAWIEHVRNTALQYAGYSLATWGLDQGGSADSGKALKLRQSRTLLTRAGKDRMGREAIAEALGVALAWADGASEVLDYRPVVELGDGMPEDPLETAQEIQTLDSAGAISTEEKVERLHPDWDDDRKAEEVRRIDWARNPDPSAPPPAGLNRVTDLITQRLGANGQQPNGQDGANGES